MKVSLNQKPKPVQYEPEILVEWEPETSVRTNLTWANPDVRAALDKLFGCRERGETVASIRLSATGIEASFRSTRR